MINAILFLLFEEEVLQFFFFFLKLRPIGVFYLEQQQSKELKPKTVEHIIAQNCPRKANKYQLSLIYNPVTHEVVRYRLLN